MLFVLRLGHVTVYCGPVSKRVPECLPRQTLLGKQLNEIVSSLQGQSPRQSGPMRVPGPASWPLPTTRLQRAYFNGSQLSGTPCFLELETSFQDLDVNRFFDSIKHLLRRHPALRLQILNDGLNQEVQNVDVFDSWELPIRDLRDATDADLDDALTTIRNSLDVSHRHWDVHLAMLPMGMVRVFARIGLIALDAGSVHHLVKELDMLYGGCELPQLRNDFAQAMRRAVQCTSLDTREVGDFPDPPRLPKVEEDRPVQRIWGCLERSKWHAFKSLCQKEGLTPTAAVTCCFQDVLRLHLGQQQDFTLNMTTTNRNRVATDATSADLVGDFTNCQLIACRVGPITFSERASAIQQRINAGMVAPVCGIRSQEEARRHSEHAFYDVVVTSLLGYRAWTPEHLPFTCIERATSQTPQVVLDFQFLEQTHLSLSFDVSPLVPLRWSQALMAQLEAHLQQVVMCADGGSVILPNDLRGPSKPFAVKSPFTRLEAEVYEAVQRHGGRIAISGDFQELNYEELGLLGSHYANQLAEIIQPQELVCIVMQKGWEQIVAVRVSGLLTSSLYPASCREEVKLGLPSCPQGPGHSAGRWSVRACEPLEP